MGKHSNGIDSAVCIKTTEMHTAGGAVRIVESGFPPLKGDNLVEKMAYARANLQHIRVLLTNEPRGHTEMLGLVLMEPDAGSDAVVAAIFFDSSVFSDMCGHMTIALARYVVDKGLVAPVSPVTTFKIQVPCGVVTANVHVTPDGKTGASSFISVPAFVLKKGVQVDVDGFGKVTVDISFGGTFYAIVPASNIGLDVRKDSTETLRRAATAISAAIVDTVEIEHPVRKDLKFLRRTILTDGNDEFSAEPTRHIVVTGYDGHVDRSPCGSGTTARAASEFLKGQIALNQTRTFENTTTKSQFRATPRKRTTCDDYAAVEIEVEGRSFYTGSATFTYEEGDPVGAGFIPGV